MGVDGKKHHALTVSMMRARTSSANRIHADEID